MRKIAQQLMADAESDYVESIMRGRGCDWIDTSEFVEGTVTDLMGEVNSIARDLQSIDIEDIRIDLENDCDSDAEEIARRELEDFEEDDDFEERVAKLKADYVAKFVEDNLEDTVEEKVREAING